MNVLSFLFRFYFISVNIYFISRFCDFFFWEMMHWRMMNDARFLYFIQFMFILFHIFFMVLVLVFILFNDKNPDFRHTWSFIFIFYFYFS